MKKMILIILFSHSYFVLSQNRYELNDDGNDKNYLSDSISVMAKDSLITDKPIVVVDGVPYRYQDLENKKLNVFKAEIESIVLIKKNVGIALYGNFAEAGVLIITTLKRKNSLLLIQ